MEKLISQLENDLRAKGFRASWAGPGAVMPRVNSPVVTLSMPRMEMFKNPETSGLGASAQLRASVFSPTALGAAGCQSEAYRVAMALSRGTDHLPPLRCRVSEAVYYGKGDYFTADVLGDFFMKTDSNGWMEADEDIFLDIDSVLIHQFQLVQFSQKREVIPLRSFGEVARVGQILGPEKYELRMKRNFPSGLWDQSFLMGARNFVVQVIRGGKLCTYSDCNWVQTNWKEQWDGSEFDGTAVSYHCQVQEYGGMDAGADEV